MKITLNYTKSVAENANKYFDKAKKLKKKIPGVKQIIEKTQKEITELEHQKKKTEEEHSKKQSIEQHKKKEWFDKFRSTKTSTGFLFVIGRDATSNEVLIKKHTEENDLIFHTNAPGSPFGVLKNANKTADKKTFQEAAQFLCCFSKQWKKGFGTADAFWVTPEQVSKKAESGEFIARGAFMIRGKKNEIKNVTLQICVGVKEEKLTIEEEIITQQVGFSGSEEACKNYCKKYVKLEPGELKPKKVATEIKKKLGVTIDDLPKFIPQGVKVLKR